MNGEVNETLWQVGDHMEAMWEDGNYYRTEVTEVTPTGYEVLFIEYGEKGVVTHAQTRELQGLLPVGSEALAAAAETHKQGPHARKASVCFDYSLRGAARPRVLSSEAPFASFGQSDARTFADCASHLETVIDRQCKGGIRLLREMAQYFQKLSAAQLVFADSIQKFSQTELAKRDEIHQEDRMPGYVDAYCLIQDNFSESGLAHRKFAVAVQTDISEFLLRTAAEQERSLKAASTEEQKAASFLQMKLTALNSAYKAASSAWKALCAVQKSQHAPKIPLAQKTAHEKFLRAEEAKTVYFAEQANYANKLITHLRTLEGIEAARLQALQVAFGKFREHEEKFLNQPATMQAFNQHTAEINPKAALEALIETWLNTYGPTPVYVAPVWQLPCPASMLAEGSVQWVDLAKEEPPLPSEELNRDGRSSSALIAPDEKKEKGSRQPSVRNLLRVAVSKKKIRYNKKGFDLDLTYVLDNVISMGFPAEGLQGQYRNPLAEVQRFFNQEHPKNYKLYNLCSELAYDPKKFEDRVARYGFDDHSPPPLELIDTFCRDVHQWLSEDPAHVAAIHCKAGKGRTGLMCACYLLYSGLAPTPESALRHFAVKRTANAKGVTIPSQMRYVWYYSRLLTDEPVPASQPLSLKQVILHGLPFDLKGPDSLALSVLTQERKDDGVAVKTVFSSKAGVLGAWSAPFDCMIYALDNPNGLAVVDGDTCLKATGAAKFGMWFNTRFLKPDEEGRCQVTFYKEEIDSALKDTQHDIFPPHFQVTCKFAALVADESAPPTNTYSI